MKFAMACAAESFHVGKVVAADRLRTDVAHMIGKHPEVWCVEGCQYAASLTVPSVAIPAILTKLGQFFALQSAVVDLPWTLL